MFLNNVNYFVFQNLNSISTRHFNIIHLISLGHLSCNIFPYYRQINRRQGV